MMMGEMKMLTNKREIILSSDEKFAEVDGQRVRVKSLREDDHEGHCWLWMELEDGDEYISYDDGQTWQDIDHNGYW